MAPFRSRRTPPAGIRFQALATRLGRATCLGRATRLGWATSFGLASCLAAGGLLAAAPARADYAAGQSKQEQQFYDYGPSNGSGSGKGGGSILDSTNPMDLMNKLRKSTAMDEATPPGDSIDQALKALNAPPAPAQQTVSVPLKAP